MKQIILFLIKIYQIFISPIKRQILGANCRYDISCSEYAIKTISKHGVLRGGILSLKRVLSCNPWGKSQSAVHALKINKI